VPAEDEAVWNRWYDQRHVPELLTVPGFRGGRRFENVPGTQAVGVGGPLPKYLALYDLAATSVLTSDAYTALSRPPRRTDEDRAMLRLFRNVNRAVLEELSCRQGEAGDPSAPAGALLAVGLVPEPAYDEEYNAWYDDEHIPFLMQVPGVLSARRFRAAEGEPYYLALCDLTAPEVRQSEAFARAIDTPWSARLRRHCERRLTGLFRPHAAEG
jgi:hypothetical protein